MSASLPHFVKKTHQPLIWSLFIGLWALALFARQTAPANIRSSSPATEDVNIALRRAAHRLLMAAGDSTSRVPPVKQLSAATWRVELNPSFKYDSLPSILQSAFDAQHIDDEYNVTITRCNDQFIQLGYSKIDVENRANGVPCTGRTLNMDCYRLQVHFITAAAKPYSFAWIGYFLGSAGLLFLIMIKWGKRQQPAPVPVLPSNEVRFGNSRLDEVNRVLFCGQVRYQLTYREAKLLHLFAQHPNIALDRSFILDRVWADEGILVGRSVDMFVSRLRKLLAADPGIRLVAVHGLGYKMEVLQ